MKIKIFTLLFFVSALSSFSQKTGNFTKTISFNSQTRYLVYHVPPTYQNGSSYKLVVGLHGCGGNANGFRTELKFLADSMQAIVVCPAGLSSNSGYMGPPDMGIIKTAIDTTRLVYNIDTTEVFLVGFSCNGFAALHDATYKTNFNYKGVISWHAAIDSTEINSAYFNFNTTAKTCLCTGTEDDNYYPTNVILRDTLLSHSAPLMFTSVSNVGHTTNFSTFKKETMKCFRFMTEVVTPTLQTTGIPVENAGSISGLIYPNPANDKITVTLNSNFDCRLLIIDSKGLLVQEMMLHPLLNEIPTEKLLPGLYLFKIVSPNGDSVSNRIIKY